MEHHHIGGTVSVSARDVLKLLDDWHPRGCKTEKDLEHMATLLGKESDAADWQKRASELKGRIEKYWKKKWKEQS